TYPSPGVVSSLEPGICLELCDHAPCMAPGSAMRKRASRGRDYTLKRTWVLPILECGYDQERVGTGPTRGGSRRHRTTSPGTGRRARYGNRAGTVTSSCPAGRGV